MRVRLFLLFVFVLVTVDAQAADRRQRAMARRNLEQIETAIQEYDLSKRFSLQPWDQMRLLDGLADQSHGLASLADCNFTHAGFVRVADLPACERLGLRAIVMPDASLKINKTQTLSDAEIDQAVRTLVQQTRRSNACMGYYICDEPGASKFAYLGKVMAAFRKQAPGKLAYINLFPGYATLGATGLSQLETSSYTEYLERYVAEVKPQLLSYDNYMIEYSRDMQDRAKAASYFRDLLEVRRVAQKHNLPFWVVVACNQIRPVSTPPSPANLLLQGWTTLAAGGHGVSWFKYQQSNYRNAPLDKDGGRTATWNYLQMVNRQLKTIGPIASRLSSVGVYFTAPAPLDSAPALPGKAVTKIEADAPLMVGEFTSQSDEVDHVLFVNLSLEKTATVKLADALSKGSLECYSPEDGHLTKCGTELNLPAGQGALLKIVR